MKPFQLVILAFALSISFGLCNQSYSQTIYFCEDVDDNGEPIGNCVDAKYPYVNSLDLENYVLKLLTISLLTPNK